MDLNRNRVCHVLDAIAKTPMNSAVNLQALGLTPGEVDILFSLLTFVGVIQQKDNDFILASETGGLLIRSISEFVRKKDVLIPVWDNRSHTTAVINKHNVFVSANILYLLEQEREKLGRQRGDLIPIKKDSTVRIAIVRRIWGKKYYLMQYDKLVGKYQLVGGRVLAGDSSREKALDRKIQEELPIIADYLSQDSLQNYKCIFKSERADEEIFLSEKFGVISQYKSYIYAVNLKGISRTSLREISKNASNKWVSIKEIEREKANDGKPIFKLAPTAIAKLKELDPTIKIAQYDLDVFLELTWVKILLFIASVTGLFPIVELLLKVLGS